MLVGCTRANAPEPAASPKLRSTPETCTDATDCRTHCEEKAWPACGRLLTFSQPDTEPQFLEAARFACSAGYALACERGASLLATKKDAGALDLATRACSLNPGDGCFTLASLLRDGVVGPQDSSSAFELFKRACAAGSARSCSEVAAAYAAGQVVNADPEQAASYFEKACQAGDATACNTFAEALLSGRGLWPNAERGVQLATRACEQDGANCLTLARLHRTGGLLEKDLQRARSLYERACQAAPQRGCPALWSFVLEFGTPAELSRAVKELARSCEEGRGFACADVGNAYRYGRGVERDTDRAQQHFERACELDGNCEGLADLAQASGQKADATRARELYERACFEARKWSACFKLGTADAVELGMAEAEAECIAGNAETCEILRARRLR